MQRFFGEFVFLFSAFATILRPINSSSSKHYYVRKSPITFTSEPEDKPEIDPKLPRQTFTCEFNIDPVVSSRCPRIYWLHNGTELESEDISSNHWNRTKVSTVNPGSYQCVVDDGYFVTVSRKAWFFLFYSVEADYNAEPLYHNYSTGETIYLKCRPNVTTKRIIWKHNNTLIDKENIEGDLIVYNATESDSGVYECTAVSQFYANSNRSAVVAIHKVLVGGDKGVGDIELAFLTFPESQFAPPDTTVHLACVARGVGLQYSWLLNDVPLPMFDSSVASVNRTGTYTCRVSNGTANITQSAVIADYDVKIIESLHVAIDYDASGLTRLIPPLSCNSFNFDSKSNSLSIEWLHNGKKLNYSDQKYTLKDGLNVTDVIGVYQCYLYDKLFTNTPYGSRLMATYQLHLKNKPNPPSKVSLFKYSCDKKMNISWTPAENFVPYKTQCVIMKGDDCSDQRIMGESQNDVANGFNLNKCCGKANFYVLTTVRSNNCVENGDFLFSTPGSYSQLVDSCSDKTCDEQVSGNLHCDLNNITQDYYNCQYNWSLPLSWTPNKIYDWSYNILFTCSSNYKPQAKTGRSRPVLFTEVPCSVECYVTVNDSAYFLDSGKYENVNHNKTFKVNSSKPLAPEILHVELLTNKTDCSHRSLQLTIKASKPSCGDITDYIVVVDGQDLPGESLNRSIDYDQHLTLPFKLDSATYQTVAVKLGNDGGESPISNTLNIPLLNEEEVHHCVSLYCADRSPCADDFVSCNNNISQFRLAKTTRLNYTAVEYSKTSFQKTEIFEHNCTTHGMHVDGRVVKDVSLPPSTSSFTVSMGTCQSICLVTEVVFSNLSFFFYQFIPACDDPNAESSNCQYASTSDATDSAVSTTAPQNELTTTVDIMIAVVILIAVSLIAFLVGMVCYCRKRNRVDAAMRESIMSINPSVEQHSGCATDCPELEDEVFQSIHPDDTTQAASERVRNWKKSCNENESDSASLVSDTVPLLQVFDPVHSTPSPHRDCIEMQSQRHHSSTGGDQTFVHSDPSSARHLSSESQPHHSVRHSARLPSTPAVTQGYVAAQLTPASTPNSAAALHSSAFFYGQLPVSTLPVGDVSQQCPNAQVPPSPLIGSSARTSQPKPLVASPFDGFQSNYVSASQPSTPLHSRQPRLSWPSSSVDRPLFVPSVSASQVYSPIFVASEEKCTSSADTPVSNPFPPMEDILPLNFKLSQQFDSLVADSETLDNNFTLLPNISTPPELDEARNRNESNSDLSNSLAQFPSTFHGRVYSSVSPRTAETFGVHNESLPSVHIAPNASGAFLNQDIFPSDPYSSIPLRTSGSVEPVPSSPYTQTEPLPVLESIPEASNVELNVTFSDTEESLESVATFHDSASPHVDKPTEFASSTSHDDSQGSWIPPSCYTTDK